MAHIVLITNITTINIEGKVKAEFTSNVFGNDTYTSDSLDALLKAGWQVQSVTQTASENLTRMVMVLVKN